MIQDIYTGFKFYQALAPQDVASGGASTDGATVDTQGYGAATIVVNVGAHTGGAFSSIDNRFQLMLEHYNSTAAAWSECYASQMIHSVVGMDGAYSTLNSGIFQSVSSAGINQAYAVGYRGPHRLIRVRISEVGGPSTMSMGAIAILGLPANWPVNEPV